MGFEIGAGLDVVGQLLRRRQRRAQVLVVLAMLFERRFHACDVLLQAVGFAQRLLVVVGDGGEKRRDLGPVEAAERGSKSLLS